MTIEIEQEETGLHILLCLPFKGNQSMSYEFTKKKIAAERKALALRLLLSGLVGVAGLAYGISTNDMHSIFGIFVASAVGGLPACAVFFSMK